MRIKHLLFIVFLIFVGTVIFAGGRREKTPETLVYLTPAWGAPSDEIIARFEERTGITLEVATVDIAASRDRVLTATAGQVNAADLIFVSADTFASFKSAGAIKNLDDLVPDDLRESLAGIDQFVLDGNLWAIPLYQQMVMIDYDKSALEAIGWTTSDIVTWDHFEEALIAMKEEGLYEYPYAAGIRPWTWYLTALSSGSSIFNAQNEPLFDDSNDLSHQAFLQVLRWFELGLISPERLSSSNPHPSFWSGGAGFHQAWQGALAVANDPERSEVAPNAAYLLLPESHATWLLPAGLTVSAFTEYPKAAMELAAFLVEEEMQRFLFEANGLFPARIEVFEALGNEDAIDGFDVMQEQAQHITSIPYDQPWYIEFEQEAEQTMLRVARGEQDGVEALNQLAGFARKLKAEYE